MRLKDLIEVLDNNIDLIVFDGNNKTIDIITNDNEYNREVMSIYSHEETDTPTLEVLIK